MEYRNLGNTGLKVSELCLGGMTLGNFHSMKLPVAGEAEGVKILDKFVAGGGNFIDTANYIYGDSELVIGRWLESKPREKFVIATKVGIPTGSLESNLGGLGRKHIKAQVEESLTRLKTSYIDLYQCHLPDPTTPIEETLRTLDELVRAGKIHYVGLSNFRGAPLQKAIDTAKHLGLAPIVSLQPQYHLLCRGIEWDITDACTSEGVGIIPWSPLAGGFLAGKYKKDEKAANDSRSEWAVNAGFSSADARNLDGAWAVLDEVQKIAAETKHTASQVSLRWVNQKKGITASIVGARTVAHIEDNLGAVGWKLTEEQMKRLDKVSEREPPYPYGNFLKRD